MGCAAQLSNLKSQICFFWCPYSGMASKNLDYRFSDLISTIDTYIRLSDFQPFRPNWLKYMHPFQTCPHQAITLYIGLKDKCAVPEKNPYPPHGRSSEIPRERGVLEAKILVAKYEAKLEFPGGRVRKQNIKPSVEAVWIFSGTAQYYNKLFKGND